MATNKDLVIGTIIMRTQTEKHLVRLEQQIKLNQAEATRLRRDLFPEEFNIKPTMKQMLSRNINSKYHYYSESKLKAYNSLVTRTNRLVVRYVKISS